MIDLHQMIQIVEDEPGYVTDLITEKATDWLGATRDPSRPFMLCVHHKAPHRGFDR